VRLYGNPPHAETDEKQLLTFKDRPGLVFRLYPPFTVEEVRAGSNRAAEHRPLACRLKHRWQKIGEVYLGGSLRTSTLNALWLGQLGITHIDRCVRCGKLRIPMSS